MPMADRRRRRRTRRRDSDSDAVQSVIGLGVVLLKLAIADRGWTYPSLAESLGMSSSEVHAAVARARTGPSASSVDLAVAELLLDLEHDPVLGFSASRTVLANDANDDVEEGLRGERRGSSPGPDEQLARPASMEPAEHPRAVRRTKSAAQDV